jgi:hypothetical protein
MATELRQARSRLATAEAEYPGIRKCLSFLNLDIACQEGAPPLLASNGSSASRSQFFAFSARIVSKIGGNQIIRAPASANIEFGCSGTYQITVGIKHFQKARLIGAGVWLNSPQCIFAYKE